MTTATVRDYEPRDEQQLRVVAMQNFVEQLQDDQSTGVEDPAALAYLDHVTRMPESGRGAILVAELENRLVGFVCLSGPADAPAQRGQQDAYAFMSDLFVIPEYRNKGAGSLLIRMAEQRALAMGAGHVALRVAVENSVSRRFYEKNRYQEKFIVMSKGVSKG